MPAATGRIDSRVCAKEWVWRFLLLKQSVEMIKSIYGANCGKHHVGSGANIGKRSWGVSTHERQS